MTLAHRRKKMKIAASPGFFVGEGYQTLPDTDIPIVRLFSVAGQREGSVLASFTHH
jgi:hypothetical protein